MQHIQFKSCPDNPDVWMRQVHKSNGSTYYEYVLLYTDGMLVISENVEGILRGELGGYFELKEEFIGPPKMYLSGHMRKVTLDNGMSAWSFSLCQYVQAAMKNIEMYSANRKDGKWKLPVKAKPPLCTTYRPELDVMP